MSDNFSPYKRVKRHCCGVLSGLVHQVMNIDEAKWQCLCDYCFRLSWRSKADEWTSWKRDCWRRRGLANDSTV